MKNNLIFRITYLSILFILATSCSQEDKDWIYSNKCLNQHKYSMVLSANISYYDSDANDTTRAIGNNWEDGDHIYITFLNGSTTILGTGVYSSSSQTWTLTSTGQLPSTSDASCRVYYFREGNADVTDSTIEMDETTAIFCDISAIYSFSNNTVTLAAAFKPYTWRLCFKGTPGMAIKVKSSSGILYNTLLNRNTGEFSTSSKDITLIVSTEGYTPYIYGSFAETRNTLRLKVGGSYYDRTIASSILSAGNSGYYTIPTTINHANWTPVVDVSEIRYVDLGLPSGILWAKCNLGAATEDEFGDFYAWGETSGYNGLDRVFDWTTYKWCDGSNYSLTKYCTNSSYGIIDSIMTLQSTDDAARVNLGFPWRVPTRTEWQELDTYTTKETTVINGISGRILTSKLNSESIFLPFGGYFTGSDYINPGTNANYWTSSLHPQNPSYAYIAYAPSSGGIRYNGNLPRCETEAIRPVYDPSANEEHDYVDLELPSGLLWATCNLGASSVEEYGLFYAWGETKGYTSTNERIFDWTTYELCNGTNSSFSKYCTSTKYGTVDSRTVLELEDDAAHISWGGSWRIPTRAEWEELNSNTTGDTVRINGSLCRKFTSRTNSDKYIILPFAGCLQDSEHVEEGINANYWSSTLHNTESMYSYRPYITSSGGIRYNGIYFRCYAQSIRPVKNATE